MKRQDRICYVNVTKEHSLKDIALEDGGAFHKLGVVRLMSCNGLLSERHRYKACDRVYNIEGESRSSKESLNELVVSRLTLIRG